MAPRVRMSLLGGFALEVDGATIPDSAWRLRKSRSVLKVLALAPGRALHPERVQGLLWPDRDITSAGNNLRQAVYQARRALSGAGADGAEVLTTRGELLALAPLVALDVDVFEAAAARAEATGTAADLEAAVAAYGGELLPEDAYEEWAAEPRRALTDRYVRLLLALASLRDPADAPEPLHRAIAADPLNEQAQRALMRAYAASGRRTQALAQFEELRAALARELAADPEPETRALYRDLLAEGAPAPADTAVAGPREGRAPVAADRPAPARHNLPWQPTSFVGRRRELDELERALATHRLITLSGPGGCGKTRLALELGRRRVDAHRDGVWLVELAAVADSALVGPAAAAALGLDLRPDEEPEATLAQHLSGRELLLVLDNCEHVLAACARLVETLLARCPSLVILTTTREPLHLPGEVDWRVPSMAMLDTESLSDVNELATSDAVELFCDRARSANPRFRLSVANAQAVAEICLRVDGLPLAIELAAARTAALAPAEIATRLADGLAVLRSARSGGLTRQQTLEGTLDWSHDLLDERERALFRRLAVFAAGFDLEAAEAIASDELVAEADVLEVLADLVDKSLVGVDDALSSYRYRLLEPVRQYAALRLRESGELAAWTRRHALWFAELAASPGARVTEIDARRIERLERDHDNLRAAMSWLLEHDPSRALEAAAGMAGLWLLRAHLREGCRWLDRALEAAGEPSSVRAEALHARQALERRRPYNYDLADELGGARVTVYRDLEDRRNEALALLDLADGAMLRGRFSAALGLAAEADALAERLDDTGLRAAVRERVVLAAAWRQDFDAAERELDGALALADVAASDPRPVSAVVSLGGFMAEATEPSEYPVARLEETSLHFRRLPAGAARASLLSHRAYLARSTFRYDEARADLETALAIARQHADVLDEGRMLAQRGMVEAKAGQLDAAEYWLLRSLELRERLREHRGILLTLASLAVVASQLGEAGRSAEQLARAQRMADEAVDGPGMGAVMLAGAEIDRLRGELDSARTQLDSALSVFYGVTGLLHYASWVHLQHAYLSLELGDTREAERRVALARPGFEEPQVQLGIDRCAYLDDCLQGANGLLTATRSTPPANQSPRRLK